MIQLEYMGTTYTCEFNRRTARTAEQQMGLTMEKLSHFEVFTLADLFWCSLQMHHPKIKQEVSEGILEIVGDKKGFFDALVDEYVTPLTTLVSEPEEGNSVTWKRV